MTSDIINELLTARTYLGMLAIRSDGQDRESLRHITGTIKKATELLKSQPETVRCKDCKWWHPDEYKPGFGDCGQGYWLHDGDWFCADGERKEVK